VSQFFTGRFVVAIFSPRADPTYRQSPPNFSPINLSPFNKSSRFELIGMILYQIKEQTFGYSMILILLKLVEK
jgi:hypothetical protein